MSDLVKRLRIKAGMIEMGETIAWGSDSALMREAADALEMAAPDAQGEPERFRSLLVECERALCCPDPAQRQVTASKILRMLAASTAPAVQGEPVALAASTQKPVGYVSQDFLDGKWSLDHIAKSDEGQISRTIPLYAAPQPAVQVEPVGWQFYQDGKWWGGDDRIKDHRKNTEEAGYPIRDVYVSSTCTPKQQPAADVAGLLICDECHDKCADPYTGLFASHCPDEEPCIMCECSSLRRQLAEQQQPALAAAAPELLDALMELADWYKEYTGLPPIAANAAIAKATGEEP